MYNVKVMGKKMKRVSTDVVHKQTWTELIARASKSNKKL